ncbi:MAG: hypothetical protein HY897_18235 [Deltaproteobacteria bacterium]|nr:hypothetical protein [Deltaproteobacteria bacterium]
MWSLPAFLFLVSPSAWAARLPVFDIAEITLSPDKTQYLEGETSLLTVKILKAFSQQPITQGVLDIVATFPGDKSPIAITKVDNTLFTSTTTALRISDQNIFSVQVFQTDTDLKVELEQERNRLESEIESLREQREATQNLVARVRIDASISLRENQLAAIVDELAATTQLIGSGAVGLDVKPTSPVAAGNPCDAQSGAKVVFGPARYTQRWLFPNDRRVFTVPAAGQVCISVKNGQNTIWTRATGGEIKLDGKTVVDSSKFSRTVSQIDVQAAVSAGTHILKLYIEPLWFASIEVTVKFLGNDTTPPTLSFIQPVDGAILGNTVGQAVVFLADDQGVDPKTFSFEVNGEDRTRSFVVSSSAAVALALEFRIGQNVLKASVADFTGNRGYAEINVTVPESVDPCNEASDATLIFGPQQFVQRTVAILQTANVKVPGDGEICVKIVNGDERGRNRVQDAYVRFGGSLVLSPNQIDGTVGSVSRRLTVTQGIQQLGVSIFNSGRGAMLTVSIQWRRALPLEFPWYRHELCTPPGGNGWSPSILTFHRDDPQKTMAIGVTPGEVMESDPIVFMNPDDLNNRPTHVCFDGFPVPFEYDGEDHRVYLSVPAMAFATSQLLKQYLPYGFPFENQRLAEVSVHFRTWPGMLKNLRPAAEYENTDPACFTGDRIKFCRRGPGPNYAPSYRGWIGAFFGDTGWWNPDEPMPKLKKVSAARWHTEPNRPYDFADRDVYLVQMGWKVPDKNAYLPSKGMGMIVGQMDKRTVEDDPAFDPTLPAKQPDPGRATYLRYILNSFNENDGYSYVARDGLALRILEGYGPWSYNPAVEMGIDGTQEAPPHDIEPPHLFFPVYWVEGSESPGAQYRDWERFNYPIADAAYPKAVRTPDPTVPDGELCDFGNVGVSVPGYVAGLIVQSGDSLIRQGFENKEFHVPQFTIPTAKLGMNCSLTDGPYVFQMDCGSSASPMSGEAWFRIEELPNLGERDPYDLDKRLWKVTTTTDPHYKKGVVKFTFDRTAFPLVDDAGVAARVHPLECSQGNRSLPDGCFVSNDAGWQDWHATIAGSPQTDLGELFIPNATEYDNGTPNQRRPNALFVDVWKVQTDFVHHCVNRIEVNSKDPFHNLVNPPSALRSDAYWVGSGTYECCDLRQIEFNKTAEVVFSYFNGIPETPGLDTVTDHGYDPVVGGYRRWYPFDRTQKPFWYSPCTVAASPNYPTEIIEGDADHDTICDEFEEYLANKYAPVYVHHPDEELWPVDVSKVHTNGWIDCDNYSIHVPIIDDDICPGCCGVPGGPDQYFTCSWDPECVDGGTLTYYSNSTWADRGIDYPLPLTGDMGFWFDVAADESRFTVEQMVCPDSANEQRSEMACGRGDGPDLFHYHHTYPALDGTINITYWRYYDLNDAFWSVGDHVAEWESARVIVYPTHPTYQTHAQFAFGDHIDRDNSVMVARHRGDQFGEHRSDFQWIGQHPVVFIERSVHGAFSSGEDHFRNTDRLCKVDECYLLWCDMGPQNCYFSDPRIFPDPKPLPVWESWNGGDIWLGDKSRVACTHEDLWGNKTGVLPMSGRLVNFGSRLYPLNDMKAVLQYSGSWGGDRNSPTGPVYGRYTRSPECSERPHFYGDGEECWRENPWCYRQHDARSPSVFWQHPYP